MFVCNASDSIRSTQVAAEVRKMVLKNETAEMRVLIAAFGEKPPAVSDV